MRAVDEAVENIGDVVTNLLRVQGKMEALRDKCTTLGSQEANEWLESKHMSQTATTYTM